MRTKLSSRYNGVNWTTPYAAAAMGTNFAQGDAVWATFGHADKGYITYYSSTYGTTVLRATSAIGSCASPHDCLTDYRSGQISRMKLMVFGGCYTGLSANPGGLYDGNLGFAATDGAGVDTAVAFEDLTYWPHMDTWSENFFGDLAAGNTVQHALSYAQARVGLKYGDTGGTNFYLLFGNPSTKLVPAGYGS